MVIYIDFIKFLRGNISLATWFEKIFGSHSKKVLKKLRPIVVKVNGLESEMVGIEDGGFKDVTGKLKSRVEGGESLDDVMAEAFAVVREASKRILEMRHFDVQVIGGAVLHYGMISEMKTGEGKTLMATLPLYLNTLTGKSSHLVTVNDYLAKRDAHWMGPLFTELGLSVGVIQNDRSFIFDPAYNEIIEGFNHLRPVTRKEAYGADITYGTNNEFGFDYLRDNMKFSLEEYVQRDLNFAIVDEVDSILIDEARTPLIISGPSEDSTDKYYTLNSVPSKLTMEEDYTVDEKTKQVYLTDKGVNAIEEFLELENLYDPRNMDTLHHVNQALRAHTMFTKDVDYVVQNGQVNIVDEFTGRLMEGRRWGEGLHQAVEAKEGVKIESENQTLATITFQNYFRMYNKLSGMTGTAETEVEEFESIYGLSVVVIPTNNPMIRDDQHDSIYKTEMEKYRGVVKDIKECFDSGRPVLVGTISIENSEKVSKLLSDEKIPHNVLNAKQHLKEAEIVAQAGRLSAITISTNMAGRGTDIVLGGNPEGIAQARAGADDRTEKYKKALEEAKTTCAEEKVKVLELGGLHIIGTERHESRRIDNQLRGRSGRQGDPGITRFYVSLDDELMRIFGGEKIASLMDRFGFEEDIPIEHPYISKAIENAQKKVEGYNFDVRKHLLEYDDVMNQQRQVVYGYRKKILSGEDVLNILDDFVEDVVEDAVLSNLGDRVPSHQWDLEAFTEVVASLFDVEVTGDEILEARTVQGVFDLLRSKVLDTYKEKRDAIGVEVMGQFEKFMILHSLDGLWKEHLLMMDHLKGGIGLRGYGNKNPLNEYKKEGFEMFSTMMERFKKDVVARLMFAQINDSANVAGLEHSDEGGKTTKITFGRGAEMTPAAMAESQQQQQQQQQGDQQQNTAPVKREEDKVGRNDPCPCGSGKKYKKCHGK